jgi:RNA polymerase sigma-70 factor (ECF subfamily)
MKQQQHPSVDAEIKAHCQRGELDEAAHKAIRHYGPGVLGWLLGICPSGAIAEDIFQNFCFDLWSGLLSFRWESSLYTWSYRVAWNSFYRFQQGERRHQHGRLSDICSQWAVEASSIHSKLQRQQTQTRLVELRQQLPEDLQSVLILRLDREFSFAEIAHVLDLSEDNARQKFQRAKNKLKDMAQREGLLSGGNA